MTSSATLERATTAIRSSDLARRRGRVGDLIGLIVEATGLEAEIGELCYRGEGRRQNQVATEVVGFKAGRTLLMPLGELHGIGPGTPVQPTGAPFRVAVGEPLLGRVIGALGTPRDGAPALGRASEAPPSVVQSSTSWRSTDAAPPDAFTRPRIKDRVGLGVRALDTL